MEIPNAIHCHHQNDFAIKMGSDVSYFDVSLTVQGKVTKQYMPINHILLNEKGEPKRRVELESFR